MWQTCSTGLGWIPDRRGQSCPASRGPEVVGVLSKNRNRRLSEVPMNATSPEAADVIEGGDGACLPAVGEPVRVLLAPVGRGTGDAVAVVLMVVILH